MAIKPAEYYEVIAPKIQQIEEAIDRNAGQGKLVTVLDSNIQLDLGEIERIKSIYMNQGWKQVLFGKVNGNGAAGGTPKQYRIELSMTER